MDRLDEAIDKEVRRLTNAEPHAGLRARVLARLDDAPPRPSAMRWWLTGAGAVAGVALVVVLSLRSSPPPLATPSETVARSTPPVAATTAPAPAGSDVPEPIVERAARTRRQAVVAASPAPADRIVQAASTDADADGVRVVPLEGLQPIDMDPVTPGDLGMSDISMPMLDIRPVRVDPISSTPR